MLEQRRGCKQLGCGPRLEHRCEHAGGGTAIRPAGGHRKQLPGLGVHDHHVAGNSVESIDGLRQALLHDILQFRIDGEEHVVAWNGKRVESGGRFVAPAELVAQHDCAPGPSQEEGVEYTLDSARWSSRRRRPAQDCPGKVWVGIKAGQFGG